MNRLIERCAMLDVHKAQVTACVRVPDGDGGRRQEVRKFRVMARIGREVVHDRDDLAALDRRDRLVDLLQEADQVKAVAGRGGHRVRLAGMHAQCGEQIIVPLLVVS